MESIYNSITLEQISISKIANEICNSLDIFQEKMDESFDGLEYVRAYIDDL